MEPSRVHAQPHRLRSTAAAFAAVALAGLSATACSTDQLQLDNSPVALVPPATPATGKPIKRTIAYRAPLGPPEDVAAELARQLSELAAAEGIALVIDPTTRTEHTMRGYVTAMAKGPTVNVSYLWDVLDTSGKRVDRISGEETLKEGVDSRRPWDAVTPAVSRMIAQKTIAHLARAAGSSATYAPAAAPTAPTKPPR